MPIQTPQSRKCFRGVLCYDGTTVRKGNHMQTNETIKKSLDYIERNLKTIITIEELASIVGYSVWHYCRLFSQIVGFPVAGYISKRRLDRAIMEISDGRKAVDVVLEYGFDTYAGFYKAFVRMYG